MNPGPPASARTKMPRAPRKAPQSAPPRPRPNSPFARRNSPPIYPAGLQVASKSRGSTVSPPSMHSIPHFLPPLRARCIKPQNPLLYFQQHAYSFAIRGEGEGAPGDVIPTQSWGSPGRCHADRREGSAFLYFVPSLLRYFLFSISFRIRTWGQTPRFAVFWPHSSALNPFRIRTSRKSVCKVFRIRTCKKQGAGGGDVCNQLPSFLVAPAGRAPFPNRSTAAWYSLARN
jgi:hypothetical protein